MFEAPARPLHKACTQQGQNTMAQAATPRSPGTTAQEPPPNQPLAGGAGAQSIAQTSVTFRGDRLVLVLDGPSGDVAATAPAITFDASRSTDPSDPTNALGPMRWAGWPSVGAVAQRHGSGWHSGTTTAR